MSVQAPTTYNRSAYNSLALRLGEGLEDLVFDYLNKQDHGRYSQASRDSHSDVELYYKRKYLESSDLMDAFFSQEEEVPQAKGDLRKRAVSLVAKTKKMIGGEQEVRRAIATGSIYHHRSQIALANFRWNCKLIGLFPFIQQIPAARQILADIARMSCDRMQFREMEKWLVSHPDEVSQVTHLEIPAFQVRQVSHFTRPLLNGLGKKIYNLLPNAIGCFTGLETLIIDSNRLTYFPPSFAKLRLIHLSAKNNYFQEMPPPLKTLRHLDLSQNYYLFEIEQITSFILGYISQEGQFIQIYMNGSYAKDPKIQNWIEAFSSDTHEVTMKVRNMQTLILVSKKLDLTQPLTPP